MNTWNFTFFLSFEF